MRLVKNIWIFGVVAALAGQSHAGFRDALKSAAGSALNEVAGAAIVAQEIPEKNSSNSEMPENSLASTNTTQAEVIAQKTEQDELAVRQQETAQKALERKQKAEQETLAKQQREKEELATLEALRSGLVAYSPKGIQWGDTKDVLIKICGVNSIGAMNVDADRYFNEAEDRQWDFCDGNRSITLWLYPQIGVYKVDVVIRDVSVAQLVKKYTDELGDPSVESIKEKVGIAGPEIEVGRIYRWNTDSHQVLIRSNDNSVHLTNNDLLQKVDEAEEKKADDALKKKEEKTKDLLSF